MLQYVIPHQEVMTHIDVGDDNSTPEQNVLRARIESNSHTPFEAADFAAADTVRTFSVRVAVWNFPAQALVSPAWDARTRHIDAL